MKRCHFIRLACFAAGLLAPGAGLPAKAAAPTPAGGIPTITGTLDFGAVEGSQERQASAAILETFPSAPAVIYVDLSIAPQVDTADPQNPKSDFHTQLYGPDGKALIDPGCGAGTAHFYGGEVAAISVGAGALYPHLLFDIVTASGPGAPYSFLACAYAPSLPGQAVLRVAGFFVVQETTIPEARQIRLVPLTPPYEQAQDALQRSHSDP